ncbi:RdRP-domain-containing protein [Auriscalpium vulgare]|uniref:RdRP-domain-containing protein n=1 Tax=Auriscalpium vulgare TaxID=40419 RepID=A0ACB8SBJ2_9AGAM|nr:RdRP-domain-containing protein [Auriscalpium vulgare]
MEIFMRGIHWQVDKLDLQREVAKILHSPSYSGYSHLPLNFEVTLFPPNGATRAAHRGLGILALPTPEVGQRFLNEYGGNRPYIPLQVRGHNVNLSASNRPPSMPVLDRIRRMPYVPPEVAMREQARIEELQMGVVGLREIQFAWETRARELSIEWRKAYAGDCQLSFGHERRELRIQTLEDSDTIRSIVVHFSQVDWSAAGVDEATRRPTIFLSLRSRPVYDSTPSNFVRLQNSLGRSDAPKRQRLLSLYEDDQDHMRVLPYASLAIRLIARSPHDMDEFLRLCKTANLRRPLDLCHVARSLGRFSETYMAQFREWIKDLDWAVAFQVELMLSFVLADIPELLSLRGRIERTLASKGSAFTVALLKHFQRCLGVPDSATNQSMGDIYRRCDRDLASRPPPAPRNPADGVFECLHVSVTPTAMKLQGPLPERSNRVLRTYANNIDSFIRVSFVEETDLAYQHDREIDGPPFIARWVRRILRDGLTIAGRHFHFLAYSQSALKSHTVWFVKPFKDNTGRTINAPIIISGLGTFKNLEFDPYLIYCPARYAARISQAFTTTDSSITVEAEEIFPVDDIMSPCGKWSFTDGVGTISPHLARDIWKELRKGRKRVANRALAYPRAFQIRFMGSKGVLSVDHTLKGRAINLRKSMIKFEAPNSLNVEIAQAFVRPSKYYLNRPLIMILENMGVPYEVFEKLQTAAVRDVRGATESVQNAAKVLDQYGLGTSYRLSSTLLQLGKLGVRQPQDGFYHQMLDYAIHHILRDLKHHARIPVRDGYTLVGVADIHGYLEESEVFACVSDPETHLLRYLEGPLLVSRSPTIHPGDVQVVRALGLPPKGSPFESESLVNTVVFSVKGVRPLPSCLGGGDLDGDVYNVTTFRDLHPQFVCPPALYDPAPKKLLDRHSTMEDVADFVADYILNDLLGLVAINWLRIADSSEEGIFDLDCLTLGEIHSHAVDYPKSGLPVKLEDIPRPKTKMKPDWNAPETVNTDDSANFYPSTRAIGRLFRAIDLPPVEASTSRRRRTQHGSNEFEDIFAELCLDGPQNDPVFTAVENRVAEFIDVEPHSDYVRMAMQELEGYADELISICAANTLTQRRNAVLSEAEVTVGTIVAKCSQARRRRDAIAQVRDQTSDLVKRVRLDICGEDDSPKEDWLRRAWASWNVSRIREESFGAKSFGWIALGEAFDAMKAIEQDENSWDT